MNKNKLLAILFASLTALCLVLSAVLFFVHHDAYKDASLLYSKELKRYNKDLLAYENYQTALTYNGQENVVFIEVTDFGVITVELDPSAAPITVANFKSLVARSFYDGLTFHRVIEDFMIQGGDPKGDGTGGSAEKITGEFSANGISNPIKHERGVISMARSSAYNSASSQFFIMHKDYPSLNGNYAAFGKVLSGMDVVDAIAVVSTDASDKPKSTVRMKTVTEDAEKLTVLSSPTEPEAVAPRITFHKTELITGGASLLLLFATVFLFVLYAREEAARRAKALADAEAARRAARAAALAQKHSKKNKK